MLRLSLVLLCLLTAPQAPSQDVTYEAYAVRFGILPAFPSPGSSGG